MAAPHLSLLQPVSQLRHLGLCVRQLALQQRLLRPHTLQSGAQRAQLAPRSALPRCLLLQPHQRRLHGFHLTSHALPLSCQAIGPRLCLPLCLLCCLQRAPVHRPLLHAGQLSGERLHLQGDKGRSMFSKQTAMQVGAGEGMFC